MPPVKVFSFQGLTFWPRDGTIYIFDMHTNETKTVTIAQFYERYKHLKYVYENGGYDIDPKERKEMDNCLEDLRKCLLIAAAQAEEIGLKDLIPFKNKNI